jgi:hypothetical protein
MLNASVAFQHFCDRFTAFAVARRVKRAARPGSRGWRWIAWALSGDRIVERVPTHRGDGQCFF